MKDTTILHSDMNCFYASVEMMLNPELRNKAVAVCGATEDRHGIVLAKSERAKKAGVKTGMVNSELAGCHSVIVEKLLLLNCMLIPPNTHSLRPDLLHHQIPHLPTYLHFVQLQKKHQPLRLFPL